MEKALQKLENKVESVLNIHFKTYTPYKKLLKNLISNKVREVKDSMGVTFISVDDFYWENLSETTLDGYYVDDAELVKKLRKEGYSIARLKKLIVAFDNLVYEIQTSFGNSGEYAMRELINEELKNHWININ